MGQSYTLSEIIRCHYRLGELDIKVLSTLAMTALNQAEKTGVRSVILYVLQALKEACNDDVNELHKFIKSLG